MLQLFVQGIAASRRQLEFQKGKKIKDVGEWFPGSSWKYSKWERLENVIMNDMENVNVGCHSEWNNHQDCWLT